MCVRARVCVYVCVYVCMRVCVCVCVCDIIRFACVRVKGQVRLHAHVSLGACVCWVGVQDGVQVFVYCMHAYARVRVQKI